MESIIPISQLRNHISQVLEEIRYGVAAQRNAGLVVDMPDEVNFQCEVIFEFQSLEIRRTTATIESGTDISDATRESESSQNQISGYKQTDTTKGTQKRTETADA